MGDALESKFDAHVADEARTMAQVTSRIRAVEQVICNQAQTLRNVQSDIGSCLRSAQESVLLGNNNLLAIAEMRGKLESIAAHWEASDSEIQRLREEADKHDSDIHALKCADAEAHAADTAVTRRDEVARAMAADARARVQFRMSLVPWAIAIASAMFTLLNFIIHR